MHWVAIVVALALLQYFYFGILVGRARNRHGVSAPAISGDPAFDRTFRVHQNTLEQLVIFVPGIFLFAYYVSAGIAALVGIVFIVGRALYAAAYLKDPAGRGPGFLLTVAAEGVLVVGGLLGALIDIL